MNRLTDGELSGEWLEEFKRLSWSILVDRDASDWMM